MRMTMSVMVVLMLSGAVVAADVKQDAQESIKKAAAFLVKQANEDGTFGKAKERFMPGIPALTLYALAKMPGERTAEEKQVMERTAAFLLKNQQPNGGITIPGVLENYNTSVSAMALKALNDPKYAEALEKAKKFICTCQMDEELGYKKDEHYVYGGFGYGNSKRPDLSNTQFALEALKDLGMDEKSPEFKNALTFVRRCQDNTETNDQAFMKEGDNTGGFIYLPGDTDACSEFGMVKTRSGKELPRPYGNMTYAGVKCLIYCGLAKDSPELKSAWAWIRENYNVKEQAGVPAGRGGEGYYYYLVAFAKAFTASGEKEIDTKGGKVNWAKDLAEHLPSLQGADGSFANKTARWMESDPILSTSYAIIALSLSVKALE
jgi:squalene-hopene/tetraprenyl-beta-curcumene cyclase